MIVSYLLEGLVILLFVRLYTRKYHYHHGLAASLVCSFYDSDTSSDNFEIYWSAWSNVITDEYDYS